MIAITAIPDFATRRELTTVLTEAGWTLDHARDGEEALARCRDAEADVLLVHEALPGGAIGLLDRLKRDSELFRVAVVLVGDGLNVEEVVSAMERGAADVLRTPLVPADVVGRATAAARTKALVKELTAQNNRLEELVLFDELTGLRNRRAILNDLDMLVTGAARHGLSLAVLMLDVDHFKAINDEHGHRVGDDVLREIGARLRGRMRGGDVAGRLGGDELLIVLPSTEAGGADSLARSISSSMRDTPVQTPSGPVVVTVSIGSAAWLDDDVEMLLERADRALYSAKEQGRDRTVPA